MANTPISGLPAGGTLLSTDLIPIARSGTTYQISGVSSMALQAASAVSITGGTISGLGTPLEIASGGTASSTASAARTALGLAIGTNVQAYSSNLDPLAATSSTGIYSRTNSTTVTNVSITGTANQITVTNGSGVAGNPTISLPSAITLTGSTITGGTFSTLDAPIAVNSGGTGLATLTTPYAVVCAGTTATGAVQPLAALGAAGTILTSNGAGALPSFQAAGSAGSLIKISSTTASSSASIAFTGLSSTYRAYMIVLTNIVAATNSVTLITRTSTNNGSTYDNGAGNYAWGGYYSGSGGIVAAGSTADTSISMSGSLLLGTGANSALSGVVYVYNPSASAYTFIRSLASVLSTAGVFYDTSVSGTRASTTAVNAIQFLMSSGNIASGTIELYGILA